MCNVHFWRKCTFLIWGITTIRTAVTYKEPTNTCSGTTALSKTGRKSEYYDWQILKTIKMTAVKKITSDSSKKFKHDSHSPEMFLQHILASLHCIGEYLLLDVHNHKDHPLSNKYRDQLIDIVYHSYIWDPMIQNHLLIQLSFEFLE